MEAKTQKRLIQYLKGKGCYVIKTRPGAGIPVGCPDILFLFKDFWGAIEVKASENAVWQPLQKPTLEKLASWSWARKVYPENVDEVIAELNDIL